MKKQDYKLFKQLVSLTQFELHQALKELIIKYYPNNIITDDYIIGMGEIPIALIAHLDTVFKYPATEIYYDPQARVIWSPDGLGADDRAGVFAIIKILQDNLRPSIIFTTNEEMGGLGAKKLASTPCPIPDLRFLIELDRRGKNDCVFYQCANTAFETFVQSFGFRKQMGSFSDISFLMPKWNICGTNLSVGYNYEHSYSEILNTSYLYKTIDKVKNILRQEEIPIFPYQSEENRYQCAQCQKSFLEFELFAVGGKPMLLCGDCISNNPHIGWCQNCGEPFYVENAENFVFCEKCEKEIMKETNV